MHPIQETGQHNSPTEQSLELLDISLLPEPEQIVALYGLVNQLSNRVAQLDADKEDLLTEVIRLAPIEEEQEDTLSEVIRLAPFEDTHEDLQTDHLITHAESIMKSSEIDRLNILRKIDTKTTLLTADAFWEAVHIDRNETPQTPRSDRREKRNKAVNDVMLLADIDDFHDINAVLTHDGADVEVLVPTAAKLKEGVRPEDLVGRWGGEEVVIFLKGISNQKALEVATRLRTSVNDLRLSKEAAGKDFIGLTIGMTTLQPGEDPKDAFVRADAAMLAAKLIPGKNSTRRFEELDLNDPAIQSLIERAQTDNASLK